MNLPFEYARAAPGRFHGTSPITADFGRARAVILPVPLDRTANRTRGPRDGPHEILVASSHLEVWDEETQTDVHDIGICTLPEMDLPLAAMDEVVDEIRRVAGEILLRGKFLVALGGEHSITPPLVAAAAAKYPGLSVLQIGAHADLREAHVGGRHDRACAMRRVLEHARATQVGIRSLSPEEAGVLPTLPTQIFYDCNMRQDWDWMERVVDSLGENVYVTLDVDGLDPAIMPATEMPEPGGLSWYETLTLLRRVVETRRVVGCDVVELSPLPGLTAPNLLCARLVYKVLAYRFSLEVRA